MNPYYSPAFPSPYYSPNPYQGGQPNYFSPPQNPIFSPVNSDNSGKKKNEIEEITLDTVFNGNVFNYKVIAKNEKGELLTVFTNNPKLKDGETILAFNTKNPSQPIKVTYVDPDIIFKNKNKKVENIEETYDTGTWILSFFNKDQTITEKDNLVEKLIKLNVIPYKLTIKNGEKEYSFNINWILSIPKIEINEIPKKGDSNILKNGKNIMFYYGPDNRIYKFQNQKMFGYLLDKDITSKNKYLPAETKTKKIEKIEKIKNIMFVNLNFEKYYGKGSLEEEINSVILKIIKSNPDIIYVVAINQTKKNVLYNIIKTFFEDDYKVQDKNDIEVRNKFDDIFFLSKKKFSLKYKNEAKEGDGEIMNYRILNYILNEKQIIIFDYINLESSGDIDSFVKPYKNYTSFSIITSNKGYERNQLLNSSIVLSEVKDSNLKFNGIYKNNCNEESESCFINKKKKFSRIFYSNAELKYENIPLQNNFAIKPILTNFNI